jgi:hypothetical protein
MKVIVILSMMALPLTAISQKGIKLLEIEFTTGTRGTQKSIRLTSDSIYIQKRGISGDEDFKHALEKGEWQQLTKSLDGLPLSQLDQLEGPGDSRASDRAWYSYFTISTPQKTYKSAHFDNQAPHKKLVPLMRQVQQLEARYRPQE